MITMGLHGLLRKFTSFRGNAMGLGGIDIGFHGTDCHRILGTFHNIAMKVSYATCSRVHGTGVGPSLPYYGVIPLPWVCLTLPRHCHGTGSDCSYRLIPLPWVCLALALSLTQILHLIAMEGHERSRQCHAIVMAIPRQFMAAP